MSAEFEILPVTSNEAVRILGSLNIKELEHLLDDIKTLRKNRLLSQTMMLAPATSRLTQKSRIGCVV